MLYAAIEKGNVEIVKLLLTNNKIDVNIINIPNIYLLKYLTLYFSITFIIIILIIFKILFFLMLF